MNYLAFLNRVIDDALAASSTDFFKIEKAFGLEGATAGFEACRGKQPEDLGVLLAEARRAKAQVSEDDKKAWWRRAIFTSEIEWTCNVVSAMLVREGRTPIVPAPSWGFVRAAEILGAGP